MMITDTHLFPWKKSTSAEHTQAINWSNGNARWEIHSIVLNDTDLSIILPHSLEVKNKIKAVVTTSAHLRPAMFRFFPGLFQQFYTLSGIWSFQRLTKPLMVSLKPWGSPLHLWYSWRSTRAGPTALFTKKTSCHSCPGLLLSSTRTKRLHYLVSRNWRSSQWRAT